MSNVVLPAEKGVDEQQPREQQDVDGSTAVSSSLEEQDEEGEDWDVIPDPPPPSLEAQQLIPPRPVRERKRERVRERGREGRRKL